MGPSSDSEELLEFFLKISTVLQEKLKTNQENLRDFEWANALWSLSNSKIYEKKLIKILDDNLLSRLSEIHVDSFSEYLHSLASFRLGNSKKMTRINEVIIEKLNNKGLSLQISHVFLWAYSFLVLENKSVDLWRNILIYIDLNKNLMKNDGFQLYYLYLLYVHLISSPELSKKLENELNNIKKILAMEKPAIINQLTVNKTNRISENETKIIDIIKKNQEIFNKNDKNRENNEKNEKFEGIELNYNGNHYFFYDNLKILMNEDISANFIDNFIILPYTADYRINKVIFEHNGKYHYFFDAETKKFVMNGQTFLKKQMMESLGLKYVEIPFYIGENEEDIVKFVKKEMDLT